MDPTCPDCGEPAIPCPGTYKSYEVKPCPFGGWLHTGKKRIELAKRTQLRDRIDRHDCLTDVSESVSQVSA